MGQLSRTETYIVNVGSTSTNEILILKNMHRDEETNNVSCETNNIGD